MRNDPRQALTSPIPETTRLVIKMNGAHDPFKPSRASVLGIKNDKERRLC